MNPATEPAKQYMQLSMVVGLMQLKFLLGYKANTIYLFAEFSSNNEFISALVYKPMETLPLS